MVLDHNLKAQFKTRCEELDLSMAEVILGLIEGLALNRFHIHTPPPTQLHTIYIPRLAHALLRDHCKADGRKRSMRRALEELIAGWLVGRFRLPPPSTPRPKEDA